MSKHFGWGSRLRSYFLYDPLIWSYTLVLGLVSIPAGFFDRDGRILHWFARTWSKLILKTIFSPVTVVGFENIDTSKPRRRVVQITGTAGYFSAS